MLRVRFLRTRGNPLRLTQGDCWSLLGTSLFILPHSHHGHMYSHAEDTYVVVIRVHNAASRVVTSALDQPPVPGIEPRPDLVLYRDRCERR